MTDYLAKVSSIQLTIHASSPIESTNASKMLLHSSNNAFHALLWLNLNDQFAKLFPFSNILEQIINRFHTV